MGWHLTRDKYMSKEEVQKLRKTLEDRANADLAKGRVSGVKAWMIMDLALSTGLRVSEIANLTVDDLQLKGVEPLLWVTGGKGRKKSSRGKAMRDPVHLNKALVRHLRDYLDWKKVIGEGDRAEDLLFVTKRKGKYTTRALQLMFKEACRRAGLSGDYSIHACRHSYGTYLFQKTKNLRLVQKELRHRNIQTTTVYADVTPEEAANSVNGIWD